MPTTTDPSEAKRQERRQQVRQKMAAATITENKIHLLTADLSRINAEPDQASDLHQASCSVLQTELASLEESAVKLIAERLPPDADNDGRRGEIVAAITDHNSELEVVVQRAKVMRKPIAVEVQRLRRNHMSPAVLALKLSREGVADPQLLVEQFVNKQAAAFATARHTTAQRALKIVEYNCTEIKAGRMSGDGEAQQRKCNCWTAECEAAQAAIAETNAEGARIHEQMLDE
jgi:hypothetical protein